MRSSLKHYPALALAATLLLLSGCSQSPAPSTAATNPPAPPQTITAKTAISPLYKAALAWSGDVQIMHMTTREVPGFKNEAGKAAMWEAAFGSPSKHQLRVYTYSIATALPQIHKGVDAGLPLAWAGQTRDAMPIDLGLFSVDSDAAYQAAAADAAPWLAKNPSATAMRRPSSPRVIVGRTGSAGRAAHAGSSGSGPWRAS